MLHAVNGRKARLATFKGAGVRVPFEDVVTSTVFGPIEFMEAHGRASAIGALLAALRIPPIEWSGAPQLRFWAKLQSGDTRLRSKSSEPDLMIVDASGPRLVIEVKWDAPLDAHELAAQWSSLPPTSRSKALHLLLVREPGRYRADVDTDRATIDRNGCGPWHQVTRSWRDVAQIGAHARWRELDPGALSWAVAVADLLNREDRLALHGWENLSLRPSPNLDWRFRRPWFEHLEPTSNLREWWNDD
jgi:hypothetical protein